MTPRPIKRVRRAAFVITNPLGAIEGAVENAVVDALRPSRGRRRTNSRGRGAQSRSAEAREERYVALLAEDEVLTAALTLHEFEVEQAVAPRAPDTRPVDVRLARRELRRHALRETGLFNPLKRWRGVRLADELARAEVAAEQTRREKLRDVHQARLDQAHERLLANDLTALWYAVSRAVAVLPLDVTVLAVEGTRIDMLLDYPDSTVVPDEAPAITPTGRPSWRTRTKTERNVAYADAVASATLATLKLVASVAPNVGEFRCAVFVDGRAVLTARVAAEVIRASLSEPARNVLENAGDVEMKLRGRTQELVALPDEGLAHDLQLLRTRRAPSCDDPFDRAPLEREQSLLVDQFAAHVKTVAVSAPGEPVATKADPDSR